MRRHRNQTWEKRKRKGNGFYFVFCILKKTQLVSPGVQSHEHIFVKGTHIEISRLAHQCLLNLNVASPRARGFIEEHPLPSIGKDAFLTHSCVLEGLQGNSDIDLATSVLVSFCQILPLPPQDEWSLVSGDLKTLKGLTADWLFLV